MTGRFHRRGVTLVAVLASAFGCAHLPGLPGFEEPGPPPLPPLSERIEGVLAEAPFDRVHWGILVVDPCVASAVEDGMPDEGEAETVLECVSEILYERNAALPFIPASNMKIAVTAAAMALLGPEYRWETALYTRMPPVASTLDGDLYLPAFGDPTLGAPFHDPPEAALAALADSLWARGVRDVNGGLVVDVSAWDSASVPGTWMVGNLDGRFGATGGAFTIRTGEIEIQVTGAFDAGQRAVIDWIPLGRGDFVENRVVTAAPGEEAELRASFLPESRRWIVEGRIAPEEERTLVLSSRNPVRNSVAALQRAVSEATITSTTEARILWDRDEELFPGCRTGSLDRCPSLTRLVGLTSPPLSEVVRAILEPSQNWMTEQLVRTLGAELGEEGSWNEGFEVITRFLVDEVGVDSLDVHLHDGSGLAAYNLLSPRSIVAVLDYAQKQPWAEEYRLAMAEPGKDDTTLSSRLEGLEGRVFAKTGTISHVNALSGYLVDDDGRELLFSIVTNSSNLPAPAVRDAIDRVVRELVRTEGDGAGLH